MAAEAGDKNFDAVLKEAKKVWKHKLNKIQVWGGTEEQHRIFYTGLYHNYMAPNLISDVDGRYIVEGKIYTSCNPQYSTMSTWDTFRATHPLYTTLEQGILPDFVNKSEIRWQKHIAVIEKSIN